MFDTLKDLFGPANADAPEQARRTATAGSPFDGLDPRDRSALITPATLKSPIVRRWAGYPPLAPQSSEGVPTATAADPSRYEVLGGWYVPADWDLKDLGRAALANASRANTNAPDTNRSGASSVIEGAKPVGARTGVDRQRPEGGRNQQAQLQTVRKTRREAASTGAQEVGSPAAPVVRPTATTNGTAGGQRLGATVASTAVSASRHSTGTQGVFGIKTGTPASSAKPRKRPSKADWQEAERHRQAKVHQKPGVATDRVTGQSASWAAPVWRLLGVQALNAREGIKRASIGAEERFGDDRDAHNTAVVRSAHEQDATVPGQTEQATVNSAVRATQKYRASQSRRAKETEEAKTADAWRAQHQTFTREAMHARAKAEQARLRGDTVDADHFDRTADDFHTAATATLADARKAGIDPQTLTAADGPGGGGGAGPDVADTSDNADAEAIQRAREAKWRRLVSNKRVKNPIAVQTALHKAYDGWKEAQSSADRSNVVRSLVTDLKTAGVSESARNRLREMLAFHTERTWRGDIVDRALGFLTGSTPRVAVRRAAKREQKAAAASPAGQAEAYGRLQGKTVSRSITRQQQLSKNPAYRGFRDALTRSGKRYYAGSTQDGWAMAVVADQGGDAFAAHQGLRVIGFRHNGVVVNDPTDSTLQRFLVLDRRTGKPMVDKEGKRLIITIDQARVAGEEYRRRAPHLKEFLKGDLPPPVNAGKYRTAAFFAETQHLDDEAFKQRAERFGLNREKTLAFRRLLQGKGDDPAVQATFRRLFGGDPADSQLLLHLEKSAGHPDFRTRLIDAQRFLPMVRKGYAAGLTETALRDLGPMGPGSALRETGRHVGKVVRRLATPSVERRTNRIRRKALRALRQTKGNRNFSGVQSKDAKVLNQEFYKMILKHSGWKPGDRRPVFHPPHDPRHPAYIVRYTPQMQRPSPIVRVVVDGKQPAGGWLMRRSDYEEILKLPNPQQVLKDLFALPQKPKYVVDFVPTAPVALRISIVNPHGTWGSGGAIQYHLVEFTPPSYFQNIRKIGKEK